MTSSTRYEVFAWRRLADFSAFAALGVRVTSQHNHHPTLPTPSSGDAARRCDRPLIDGHRKNPSKLSKFGISIDIRLS